jgi:mono/diheme cytochrome c family protein
MGRLISILVRVVLTLIILLVVAIAVVWSIGSWKLNHHPSNPVPVFTAVRDTSAIARGRHLAEVGCTCHNNVAHALAGSDENFAQIPKGPNLGELYAPNITAGGVLTRYANDGLLARAIREGVGADGRVLVVMPSAQFHAMSDADLGAVISYVRSQPAVAGPTHRRGINALGLIMLGAGVFNTGLGPPITTPVNAAPRDTTAEYGAYMVTLLACRDCHGPDLHGAPKSSLAPRGPNLVALAAAHPVQRFSLALRGGIGVDGHPLDPGLMPWNVFKRLDDLETVALYRYLRSLGGGAL